MVASGPAAAAHRSSSQSSLASLPENADAFQTDWRSIRFITFICVMDAMRISAVLVNSWPYLSSVDPEVDEEFFGLSKSAFTLGAIVASVLSGWLSNRISHTKPPILAGLLTATLACLFFANLEMIPRNRRYGFLIAEILFGVATGAIQTWRVHIAMSSTDADRSKATSLIGFAINLGFVLGPVIVLSLGYLLSAKKLLLPWGSHFSIYTAPIYLMAFLSLCGALFLLFCFDGRMRRMGKAKRGQNGGNGQGRRASGNGAENWAKEQLEKTPLEMTVPNEGPISADSIPPCTECSLPRDRAAHRPDCAAILACFVARFCFMAFILYLMALATPYSMSVFGWTGEEMVFYQMLTQGTMGLMGILVCLGYTLRLLSHLRERFCVLVAMSLMLAFFLASFPWPFLSAELPLPLFRNETTAAVNGTSARAVISHGGCDPQKYGWCQSTPAINVFVYHAALILCLGIAMPVGQLNLDVLYSRILGPIKQGTMQGLFVAVGDLVSLCGPLIITTVYQKSGPRPVWIGEICILALGIAFWAFSYPKLLPANHYEPVQLVDSSAAECEEWTNEMRRQANGLLSSREQNGGMRNGGAMGK